MISALLDLRLWHNWEFQVNPELISLMKTPKVQQKHYGSPW